MIPVIDFKKDNVLEEIRKAYTTVGFAVFTNALSGSDQTTMNQWFDKCREFFELSDSTKKLYKYDIIKNLDELYSRDRI